VSATSNSDPENFFGSVGASLFDSDWDDAASRRRSASAYPSSRDELFRRRLTEAQAFGAASEQLALKRPELSARWGMNAKQRIVGFTLCIGYVVWAYLATSTAVAAAVVAVAIAFGVVIAVRFWTVFAAWWRKPPPSTPRLGEDALQTLTVLVPLYREASVVPQLIAAISRLDYPSRLLDVKLLVEADDPETIAAIEAQQLPAWFEVIPVPPGEPRTKPKALNYALAFARGDVVAIFDAEDLPSSDQPRAAMAAFQKGPDNLAVVQAPLQVHNGGDSWIARQFALEYAIHFRVWLPLLAQLKLPIPLGGTSNYFRRDMLQRVGGWDAWNVTEDADIGIRLARFGYLAGMVTPETLEEAPTRWRQWRNQRTRWIKGHVQTWLVLNRHPLRAMRDMGVVRYMSTHVTLGGGILASMLHGPLYLWVAASIFVFRNIELWHGVMFGLGYLSAVLAAITSKSKHATPWMIATMPIYWPLQSLATLRALLEMHFKPHFWSKTQHGVTASQPDLRASNSAHPQPLPETGAQLHFQFFHETAR
jgi:cellulose synthase/poly-beta-1,6-N-acetylglucosamine synthase-like glycosyltransferase